MNGAKRDGLQMDAQTSAGLGGQKTGDPKVQAIASFMEPVAGIEPRDLPFTRRRYIMTELKAHVPNGTDL